LVRWGIIGTGGIARAFAADLALTDSGTVAAASFTLIPRAGEPRRFENRHEGQGLRHGADEVARCLGEGRLESPLMPLDETVAIMETMDTVLAQASGPGR
jgi:hypothetical protein